MGKLFAAIVLYLSLPTRLREAVAGINALAADVDYLRVELGKLEAQFDLTELRADTVARSFQALEDRVSRAERFVRRPLDEFTAILAANDRAWRGVLHKMEAEHNGTTVRRNERKFPPRVGCH